MKAEDIHIWSVQHELDRPQAALDMRALREFVASEITPHSKEDVLRMLTQSERIERMAINQLSQAWRQSPNGSIHYIQRANDQLSRQFNWLWPW